MKTQSQFVTKDVHFILLRPDVKIPMILFWLGTFAFVGYLLPAPFADSYIQLFDIAISVVLGVLAWCLFRLIAPIQHGGKWVIAELTIVPLIWLSTIIATGVWFLHLQQAREAMHVAL